jgi:hypothetical protein
VIEVQHNRADVEQVDEILGEIVDFDHVDYPSGYWVLVTGYQFYRLSVTVQNVLRPATSNHAFATPPPAGSAK